MKLSDWAEKEIKYACERERKASGTPDGEWDYGCACYESALKAFKCLMDDGHSGMSIGITKNILVRLMDGKPLTPIEDVDDVWGEPHKLKTDVEWSYQCKRMSSLFKHVYKDDSVTYSDVDRVVVIDGNSSWYNGFVSKLIHKMYPITMPYAPPAKPYKVYEETFLYEEGRGDYDTMGLLYVITPDDERVELNKFYKEGPEGWIEIDENEYQLRKDKYREVEE